MFYNLDKIFPDLFEKFRQFFCTVPVIDNVLSTHLIQQLIITLCLN